MYSRALDFLTLHGTRTIDGQAVGTWQHIVLDLLHMALLNNFAATSHVLGEYEHCKRSLVHLRSFASALELERGRELDAETRRFLEWHIYLFRYNAIMLEMSSALAAAA
jgi:hypothetical protein